MKYSRFLFVLVVISCLGAVSAVAAQEYTVTSGYDSPVPAGADARVPVPVPFWSLPLWLMLAQLVLVPPEILVAIKLWAYMGIRRVSGGNVLDQDVRARIYGYICQNPGIHLRGLSTEMQVKLGTLRYHLSVLQHTHKIAVSGDNASIRFYENSGTYSTEEQQILKHLRNETTKKILGVLLDRPMVTRQDIADAVGVSGPSVSWHMKRLEEDHIVLSRREGRLTAYEIPGPVAGYLNQQIRPPAPTGPQDYSRAIGQA
ncbi:winged helix-turn-helix transcriptional regulator [Methanoregula sp.]|uniref:winged helix-turn-helix transcriptional regulator n=1 Tax=Methanoregula sp. TaxID=2052170 RepID=UPI0023690171|nr:winged helix-turn-helix transcriptional regulator [Methanoregula sp.]MDD1686632.1 winged helix-turn-helix transcriptional regulator [Methanoregula sp.]